MSSENSSNSSDEEIIPSKKAKIHVQEKKKGKSAKSKVIEIGRGEPRLHS